MTNPPPTSPGRSRRRRRSWPLAAAVLAIAAAAGVYLSAAHGDPRASRAASATSPTAHAAAVGSVGPETAPLAPNGTFTAAAGATETIASLEGKPILVWFVAGGCASCAASIPAVSTHLQQLTGRGIHVVTLGLYGAFPNGKAGVAQLLSFGRGAAGGPVTRPDWSWGMASEALSMAYDPSGTPDVYDLVGPHGHIRYRNSVPDSTMPKLLAAAARLTGTRAPASHGSPATSTATLP